MLQKVKTAKRRIKDYQGVIDDDLYDEVLDLGKKLQGLRVLHINATNYGGGVAEILQSLIPLLNDVGLSAEWQVIEGNNDFFNITKFLHNSFQNGQCFQLTKKQTEIYEKINKENADRFEGDYDLIIVHDPQPVALPFYINNSKAKYIWRLHIDTSSCNDENWSYFSPFLAKYSACIFSSTQYAPETIPIKEKFYIPPAIDPFHPKNIELDKKTIKRVVEKMGIDITRPLITQVSRFDPWKDPVGVVKAYKIAKKKVPGIQLALVASMANDDPEGWKIYEETKRVVGNDPDIHLILSNDPKTNDINVNSIQRLSNIIIQKSLKEGFGLVVTEAMWKERPVIGGNTVGIRMQIEDGKNGLLVSSIEECAERIVFLLQNKDKANKLGENAKESVRKNFLLPRFMCDHLRVYEKVLSDE